MALVVYCFGKAISLDAAQWGDYEEAAELLGMAKIEKGDIWLTPLGETFSEASILARKEIFASRIKRVPQFRWLLTLLRSARNQRLDLEVVQTALELEFPSEEAKRQLDTIIH